MNKIIRKYDEYVVASRGCKENLPENVREDLNIDNLFEALDYTSSAVGRQYFYHLLCTDKVSTVASHEQLVQKLKEDIALRRRLTALLGKLENLYAYSIVDLLSEKPHEYSRRYLTILQICRWLPLLFFVATLIVKTSPIPFFCLIVSYLFNGLLHFKQKNLLSCYFYSIPQLYKLMTVFYALKEEPAFAAIKGEMKEPEQLHKLYRNLEKFRFGIALESESAMAVYMITELINIFTLHATINIVHSFTAIQFLKKEVGQVFSFVGYLDVLHSICTLRENVPYFCHPTATGKEEKLNTLSVYHPLISNCVGNDLILTDKSVLITGSNMSGKTCFMRTIAINLLTGKTINTCFAHGFSIDTDMKVYSVICTKDDLLEGKSYFFKEAENVKRALEESEKGNRLIILDELFKGTNTTERIAINATLLSMLSQNGNIIFASTHDLKLAELLKGKYEFYHFCETIVNDKLTFDHKLHPNICKEGNAIRILGLCGYPPEFIHDAYEFAK